MKWGDLLNTKEYKFGDGAIQTQTHTVHNIFCYRFWLKKHPKDIKDSSLTLSEDHLILCKLKNKLNEEWEKYILTLQQENIPTEEDVHVYYKDGEFETENETIETESWIYDEENNIYWLSAKVIFILLSKFGNRFIRPVDNKFVKWEAVGERKCFCISTDIGRYKCCGVINHNSVALRNIIFHSLTHSDDIVLGLVDLKLSEFSRYKGVANVCGVANSVGETAELLRIGREVMYKRNSENAENGLTDFMDFKPQGPTNIIRIFGHEYDENTEFDVKVNGEDRKMTAKEMLEFIQENSD